MFRLMMIVGMVAAWSAGAVAATDDWSDDDLAVYTGVIDDDILAGAGRIDINADVKGDVFLAGGEVSVAGAIAHQLVAAGGELDISSDVTRDILAAAGKLDVSGAVGDNLLAAAGRMMISSKVAGKIVATGWHIEIGPDAVVENSVWLGGGKVIVKGTIRRDLKIAAGKAQIYGNIDGDVIVEGDSLVVQPGARIMGSLIFKGPKAPVISKDALIKGQVRHIPHSGVGDIESQAKSLLVAAAILPLFFLFIIGAVMALVMPACVRRTADQLGRRPMLGLGLGILLLFGLPVVFIALFITVIGIPLALIGLALYCVALMTGAPLAGVSAARLILARKGGTPSKLGVIGVYLVILAMLAVMGWLPFIGGLIGTLVLCIGIGAGTLAGFAMMKGAADKEAEGAA